MYPLHALHTSPPGLIKAAAGSYVYGGMALPSVTTVVGWLRGPMPDLPVVQHAAAYGRVLHAWCEAWVLGQVNAVAQVPPVLQVQIGAMASWLEHNVEAVLFTEAPLVDPRYGYAGTPDLVVKCRGGFSAVIDYKSSTKVSNYYWLQLEAYVDLVDYTLSRCTCGFAHNFNPDMGCDRLVFHMPRREPEVFRPVSYNDTQVDAAATFETWRGLRDSLRWRTQYGRE